MGCPAPPGRLFLSRIIMGHVVSFLYPDLSWAPASAARPIPFRGASGLPPSSLCVCYLFDSNRCPPSQTRCFFVDGNLPLSVARFRWPRPTTPRNKRHGTRPQGNDPLFLVSDSFFPDRPFFSCIVSFYPSRLFHYEIGFFFLIPSLFFPS